MVTELGLLDTLTKSRDRKNPRVLEIHPKVTPWEIEIQF